MLEYNITLVNIFKKEVFSNVAYEKQKSRQFIKACKSDCLETVFLLLQYNRFLTYDYDHCYQTGLHWACRRNNLEIVKVILNAGGDINCKNMIE